MIEMATPTIARQGAETSRYDLIPHHLLLAFQGLLAQSPGAKEEFERGTVREAFNMLSEDGSHVDPELGLLKSELLMRIRMTLPTGRGGI